jgi:hypothetical protein
MAKIELPNNCYRGKISVVPIDWKSGGKELLKKNWRIIYWFFDQSGQKKQISTQ